MNVAVRHQLRPGAHGRHDREVAPGRIDALPGAHGTRHQGEALARALLGLTAGRGGRGATPETVRAWAQAHGLQPYVLIRTLGHLPGCRVTPDGGLRVREAP